MTSNYVRELRKRSWRFSRFLRRNLGDLKSVNRSIMRRKVASLMRVHFPQAVRLILGFPIGLIGATLIRILRPVVLIRIGSINTTRLGHMLIDVEMATAEREIGANTFRKRTIDVWYPWTRGIAPANSHLLRMWRRTVHILPTTLLEPVAEVNKLIPGGSVHVIPYRKGTRQLSNFNDVNGALRATSPHLKFETKELYECQDRMRDLGIDSGDKVVCIHVRTAAYLVERLGRENSSDHDLRDAEIADHYEAILMLAERGYKVVRMGTELDAKLTISHPNLIDYACSGLRSELMDLYLPSKCEFFIGVLSGPSHVAQLFRRPLLLTNLIPLSRMMLSMDNFLFIPKKILDEGDQFLSLDEIASLGIEDMGILHEYERRGMRVLDNSSSEIVEAVEEMSLRISGEWLDSEWDEWAQRRFKSLLPDYLKVGSGEGKIASSFLRGNSWYVQ